MNDRDKIREGENACTLKEACAAAAIHGEALCLLVILVWSFPWVFGELVGGFSGPLPAGTQFLVLASARARHWLIIVLCSVILLAADVQIYRGLLSKKGRVASAIWSLAVSTALTMATLSFGYLYLKSLLWIGSYQTCGAISPTRSLHRTAVCAWDRCLGVLQL